MTQEEVLEKLRFDTQLRGLSIHTQEEYLTKVKAFQNHFNKPATEMGLEATELLYFCRIHVLFFWMNVFR